MPMIYCEDYHYRANVMPARFYEGPRVIDSQSGGQFYQAYAVRVEKFGDIVDSRKNHYDFDAEAEVGIYDRPGDSAEDSFVGTTGGASPSPINPAGVVNNAYYNP